MADAAPNTSPTQGAAALPAEIQTPVDPRKRLAAWYLLCGHRALWRLPLIPAVALLVGFLMLRGTFSDPQANLAESQRLIDEIKPAPVPGAENAALVYQQAFAAHVAYGGPRDIEPTTVAGRNRTLFDRPDHQAFFAANALTIQLLLKGSKMPRCNWGVDYKNMLSIGTPYLSRMRSSARLLAAHARLLAFRGDHAGAAQEIGVIYRMARHVKTDPVLINGLLEVSMNAMADSAIQQIVLWDTPETREEIEFYRMAILKDRRPLERYIECLKGEAAATLNHMDQVAAGLKVPPDPEYAGIELKFAKVSIGGDRACYKAAVEEIIERALAGTLPHNDNKLEKEIQTIIRAHQDGPAGITNLVLGMLARTRTSFYRCANTGAAVEIGLAFLAFRARYGRDPESLESLVPEFLAELPVDHTRRKPFRIRIDPDGMSLESLETAEDLSRACYALLFWICRCR